MGNKVETIGEYRVLHPIGEGGMAEVFAVEKTGPAGFEKKLCLKRIRREFADNDEFVQSFESEARIVSRLQHPNIVQVFDFFRHEKDLCLVMELIDGMDLNSVLRMVNGFGLLLPVDITVYILESLFLALEHAHHLKIKGEEVSVIHRDVSPHNILISTAGVVKLVDFGVAKAKGLSHETKTGVVKGKLCYLSPEQLKGGGAPLGPESDLFATGVVFWEMLAKERLFKATMEHQIIANVMNFEKAPIEHLHPRVNHFLEKILAPNPQDRFQSADDALHFLKRIGVRPCSQADIAQVVKQFKALKELCISENATEDSYEQDPLSKLSKMKTKLERHYNEAQDEHGQETHDIADSSGTMATRMSVTTIRHRVPVMIAVLLIAVILTGAGVAWHASRTNKNNVEANHLESIEPVLKKETSEPVLIEQPDDNPVKVLDTPGKSSLEEGLNEMHVDNRLKDGTETSVTNQRAIKSKKTRRRNFGREPERSFVDPKTKRLVPFGAD